MKSEEIGRIQEAIDQLFMQLGFKIRRLAVCKREAKKILRDINMLSSGIAIQQSMPGDFVRLCQLFSEYTQNNNELTNLLRSVDQLSARIAAYLSVAIEESFNNRDTDLKMWIRSKIDELDDLREIKLDMITQKRIELPTAVGILTPYLAKTRTGENSSWFASVRNAIRRLSR